MRGLVVVVLVGCAARSPRPACGPEWQPLAIERAPARSIDVARKDDTTIERVEVAGVAAAFANELSRELRTRAGMTLIDAPIRDDLRRLWKLGVVDDVHVELDAATVRFVVATRPTIRTVVRTGGDRLAQARFRQLQATSYEPARVQRMAEALRESYVQDGRLDARVEARQRTHATGVDVCVAIDPGARITIGALEFPGRKALAKRELLAALPKTKVNRPGGIYDEATLEHATWYLLAEYWNRGYIDVAIRPPVLTRRGAHLDVAIPIEEGAVYRLGHIRAPLPVALRRGGVFSRSQIMAARDRLEQQLAAYKPLAIEPATTIDREARTVDIELTIAWRWPWDAVAFWLSRSR